MINSNNITSQSHLFFTPISHSNYKIPILIKLDPFGLIQLIHQFLMYINHLSRPMKPQKFLEQKVNKASPEQFLITMSDKQNRVIKFINHGQQIKTQKVISLHINNDRQLLSLFYAQLDRIKDYLVRRYELKSQLQIDKHVQIREKQDGNHRIIKINTKYWQYPTLQALLHKQSINPNQEIDRDRDTLLHFIQEFFEIIIRAGGIDYFFYTPKNLFIISPRRESFGHIFDKIKLNFTSMAGLKLFAEGSKIYRQDLWEIYPLIPPNFYELRQQKKYIELNTIIKKRALAFLILCFVIRKVPDLLNINKLEIMVTESQIKSLIKRSAQILQKVIKLFDAKIKQAEKETGISLQIFFTQIFIKPYQSQEATLPTWLQIYTRLFEENTLSRTKKVQLSKQYSLPESSAYFQQMLMGIWSREASKRYFLDREYAINQSFVQQQEGFKKAEEDSLNQELPKQTKDNKKTCLSIIYFLAKFNCSFHKILRYPDPCLFILTEHFSEDINQVVVKLMKTFTPQMEAFGKEGAKAGKIEEVQVHEKPVNDDDSNIGKETPDDAVSSSITDQNLYEPYNPFLVKPRQEILGLNEQLGGNLQQFSLKNNGNQIKNIKSQFLGKIQDASSFLGNAYSLRHLDKQSSNRDIVSLTNKQVVLNDLCSSLWNF